MKLKNACLLFLAAAIWGVAFVAQSVGMDYIGPFTFNGVRSLIGSLFLACFLLSKQLVCKQRKQDTADVHKQDALGDRAAENRKILWSGGICCGLVLTVASTLQQLGIQYTTVGKAGFVTALYIVFVPIISLFFKKKAGIKIWISVVVAAFGLYLLCMTESLTLQRGDFYVLLGAITFAIHILVIDYFSPKTDGVKMSCIQFFVCGILCSILMLCFEDVQIAALIQAGVPILYAGICSCGIAYTLQIVGQKDMNPTIASLILSLESVISAISGFVILKQNLSFREMLGCVLMFAAIILAQLPDRKKR